MAPVAVASARLRWRTRRLVGSSSFPLTMLRSMRPTLTVMVPLVETRAMIAVPPQPEVVAAAVSKVDNLGLAERSILVYNLLNSVSVPMLFTLFENAGPVEHVVLRPGDDGRSQVAMVLFAHKPSVKFSVTAFDNCLFCGQIIRVMSMSASTPTKVMPPPPSPPTERFATPPLTPRAFVEPVSDEEMKECVNCAICQLFRARYNGEISVDDVLDSLPSLRSTTREHKSKISSESKNPL
ncbi:hypothetical protein QR680_003640 [Steinernema hermaphroditum]|uniref:RRM domain-containing protein n=1 Tax=Steinernema hermaphroditum TaxID=289476 RepID=A0AA39HME5_9BILA|nr:hypothetical protein QR680_003640 [Steinernema hermaphroditum]